LGMRYSSSVRCEKAELKDSSFSKDQSFGVMDPLYLHAAGST
jgi:hypothetical protein